MNQAYSWKNILVRCNTSEVQSEGAIYLYDNRTIAPGYLYENI